MGRGKRRSTKRAQRKPPIKGKRKAGTRMTGPRDQPRGLCAHIANGNGNDGGTITHHRYYRNEWYFNPSTDEANIESNVLDYFTMLMIRDKTIDKWNPDQRTSYKDLIPRGTRMLVELRNNMRDLLYIPTLTRSDTTNMSPLTPATMTGLLHEICTEQSLLLPTVCFAWAELYTGVIQLMGAEGQANSPGYYLAPFTPYMDYAELVTLLGEINAEYDAVVFASQADDLFKAVSIDWLRTVPEYSFYSDYACLMANVMPMGDDAGSTYHSAGESGAGLSWSQHMGIPETFDAIAAFRSTDATTGFLSSSNAGANTLTVHEADLGDNGFTDIADTTTVFDWTYCASDKLSHVWSGPYSVIEGTAPAKYYDFTNLGGGGFNRALAMWLRRHARGIPVQFRDWMPLLADMIPSRRRMSGGSGVAGPRQSMSQEDFRDLFGITTA